MNEPSIRIDKWLWHARFFKTRTLAQTFVTSGKVRLNKERIEKANQAVKPGDVLTFTKGPRVFVIEVIAIAARRGPASEAQALYNDLSPPPKRDDPDTPTRVAERDKGAGRPTKRERRETDKLRGG